MVEALSLLAIVLVSQPGPLSPVSLTEGPPVVHATHPPTPHVVYLDTDGEVLTRCEDSGSNGADSCATWVESDALLVPPYSGDAQALRDALEAKLAPYGVVVTSQRPPEYVPYLLLTVGGNAVELIGSLSCAISSRFCEAPLRSYVVAVFEQEECGSVLNGALNQLGSSWGLDRTERTDDAMYQHVNGDEKSFLDECIPVIENSCPSVHSQFCPDGQQNAHAELLANFGTRTQDRSAPTIEVHPPDGSVFAPGETILVTAQITDDSNFFGVRWTWVDGRPENAPETACTNRQCDRDLDLPLGADPSSQDWTFLTLEDPPLGSYSFMVEATDAHGNGASRLVTFEVREEIGDGDSTGSESGSATMGDDSGVGDAESSNGDGAEPSSGTGASTGVPTQDESGDSGCGCRNTAPTTGFGIQSLLALVLVTLRRR